MKKIVLNDTEILFYKQCGYYKVSRFDLVSKKTTYMNSFETYKGGHECYKDLINIENFKK